MVAMGDDSLQTLTDARLNAGLPSDQRATLISVSSMCFSVVMLVLSPLAGILMSCWAGKWSNCGSFVPLDPLFSIKTLKNGIFPLHHWRNVIN